MSVAQDIVPNRKAKATNRDRSTILDRHVLVASAIRHISNYFKDIGVSPDIDLYSDRYIDICAYVDICCAVDMAYKSMKEQNKFQSSCGDGTMGEDVRLVIRLLKGIRAKCIPQEFSAGILLMYLEIVEGLRF